MDLIDFDQRYVFLTSKEMMALCVKLVVGFTGLINKVAKAAKD